jgi:hypothetical protein
MLISPQTGPPVNPDPVPTTYLCVAPSRGTCPRKTFSDLASALSWGERMSTFYKSCFAVFHVDGDCLTLVQLLPPFPRDGEVVR